MKLAPVVPSAPPGCVESVTDVDDECFSDERTLGGSTVVWRHEEEHRLKSLFLEHEQRIVQGVVRAINERKALLPEMTPFVSNQSPQRVQLSGVKQAPPTSQGAFTADKVYSSPVMPLPPVGSEVPLDDTRSTAEQSVASEDVIEVVDRIVPKDVSDAPRKKAGFTDPKASLSDAPRKKASLESEMISELPTPAEINRGRGTSNPSRFSRLGESIRASGVSKPKWTLAQTQKNLDVAKQNLGPKGNRQTRIHVEQEGGLQHIAQHLLECKPFQAGLTCLIIASAMFVGVQADYAIKYKSMPWEIKLADNIVTFFFAAELLIRLVAEGPIDFVRWRNKNLGWNLLDSLLVLFSIIDQVLHATHANSPDMSIFRTVRIFRLVRVFRIIRVARFFNELRIMVSFIISSMKLLVWALILLFIITFIFAVCVLELVSMEVDTVPHHPQGAAATPEVRREFESIWGSLLRAVFALFQSITGGVDWNDIADPLINVNPMIGFVFVLYISMALFCVLNIVTGIFVENAKAMHAKDENNIIMETIETRKEWIAEVKSLWKSCATDTQDDAEIGIEEFVENVSDFRIQALFHRLGLEIENENLPGLFALLDFSGNGTVNIDEFAMGIQMLHGQAKSIDMARIRYNVAQVSEEVSELRDMMTLYFTGVTPPAERKKQARPSNINVAC